MRPPTGPATTDVLRGTLELLILRTLSLGPMHGWSITQRIQQLSSDALQVGQGSLYPALQRLEQKGWLSSDWEQTDQNRRVRVYRLTRSGRAALKAETANWRGYVAAVESILGAT
jgi:transcriptional regulator